jgi:hypothetical protein
MHAATVSGFVDESEIQNVFVIAADATLEGFNRRDSHGKMCLSQGLSLGLFLMTAEQRAHLRSDSDSDNITPFCQGT